MIDLDDILNLLFPGLDDGFIIFVVIILIVAGIAKLFKHKEKPQTDNKTESFREQVYDSIYEFEKGKIVAEAFPLELFLTDDSEYISLATTTTPSAAPIVKEKKQVKKNNNSKYIVQANIKSNDNYIYDLFGLPHLEGFLRTTYKGRKIEISCYLKDITIEKLRQHKEDYVVCKYTGFLQIYKLKRKIDVIISH